MFYYIVLCVGDVCMCVCAWARVCMCSYACSLGDNFQELVLSLHCVAGSWRWNLGRQALWQVPLPMSHLTSPYFGIFLYVLLLRMHLLY